jgi:cell division protein FtsQ
MKSKPTRNLWGSSDMGKAKVSSAGARRRSNIAAARKNMAIEDAASQVEKDTPSNERPKGFLTGLVRDVLNVEESIPADFIDEPAAKKKTDSRNGGNRKEKKGLGAIPLLLRKENTEEILAPEKTDSTSVSVGKRARRIESWGKSAVKAEASPQEIGKKSIAEAEGPASATQLNRPRRFWRRHMSKTPDEMKSLTRPTRKPLSPTLKKTLLAATLLVLMGLLFWVATQTSFLNVKNIDISGNQKLDSDYLRSLAGIEPDTRLYRVNVEAVEQSILSDPYVAAVSISRRFPDTVAIAITERQPQGIIFQNGSYYLVDKEGYVLESVDKKPEGLVEIQGLDIPLLYMGQRIETDAFATITALIQSMPDELRGITLSVGYEQKGGLYARARGTKVIYGESSDLSKKSEIALLALNNLTTRYARIDYIDVTYPEHPVIKPIN